MQKVKRVAHSPTGADRCSDQSALPKSASMRTAPTRSAETIGRASKPGPSWATFNDTLGVPAVQAGPV